MPKIEKCTSGRCRSDKNVVCKHKFAFDPYVLNGLGGQSYLQFVQLLDYQVILHFLYFIAHKNIPGGRRNARFIIVTRDKKFLASAEREWLGKAKPRTRPCLNFGPGFVKSGKTVIYVECIESKPYGSNRRDDLDMIARQLNNRFGKRASS